MHALEFLDSENETRYWTSIVNMRETREMATVKIRRGQTITKLAYEKYLISCLGSYNWIIFSLKTVNVPSYQVFDDLVTKVRTAAANDLALIQSFIWSRMCRMFDHPMILLYEEIGFMIGHVPLIRFRSHLHLLHTWIHSLQLHK